MTVGELKKELEKCDDNQEIVIQNSDNGFEYSILDVDQMYYQTEDEENIACISTNNMIDVSNLN